MYSIAERYMYVCTCTFVHPTWEACPNDFVMQKLDVKWSCDTTSGLCP